jgi:hypothetical protein
VGCFGPWTDGLEWSSLDCGWWRCRRVDCPTRPVGSIGLGRPHASASASSSATAVPARRGTGGRAAAQLHAGRGDGQGRPAERGQRRGEGRRRLLERGRELPGCISALLAAQPVAAASTTCSRDCATSTAIRFEKEAFHSVESALPADEVPVCGGRGRRREIDGGGIEKASVDGSVLSEPACCSCWTRRTTSEFSSGVQRVSFYSWSLRFSTPSVLRSSVLAELPTSQIACWECDEHRVADSTISSALTCCITATSTEERRGSFRERAHAARSTESEATQHGIVDSGERKRRQGCPPQSISQHLIRQRPLGTFFHRPPSDLS